MIMQHHPSYAVLNPLLFKYPLAAGSLFQTYNDVLLTQHWTDIQVVDLAACARAAIKGRRPDTEDTLHVVPCSLTEPLSMSWLKDAFDGLENPPEVYLAINSSESSIVYYKVSADIVKPSH